MTYTIANIILNKCVMSDHSNKACQLSSGQHVCTDCWNAYVFAHRRARKEQLAIEPRCEVERCKSRATLKVAGHTRMCRKHFKKAEWKIQGMGVIGFCASQ